jgi:hypothetical protein
MTLKISSFECIVEIGRLRVVECISSEIGYFK